MRVVVATHGHCFDGLASAALFTALHRKLNSGNAEFGYRACGYGAGQQRPSAELLNGDENALLDFRLSALPQLQWFFDHHRTAFPGSAEREFFERQQESGRYFYDADYSSCTKLIADVAREKYDFSAPELKELIDWADLVDAARFESAKQAVDREHPVLQLVSVVEHYGDDSFLTRLVPELLDKPLLEIATSQFVSERYRPLAKKHARFIERVREQGEVHGRVVFVDLTGSAVESVGKFVTYALYPESTYSVVVGLLANGAKISVGYNPWSGKPLDTDISAICARYGGGGHPVVGGISFKSSELERARSVARDITRELMG